MPAKRGVPPPKSSKKGISMNLYTEMHVETESGKQRVPQGRIHAEGIPRVTTDRCASSSPRSLAKWMFEHFRIRG